MEITPLLESVSMVETDPKLVAASLEAMYDLGKEQGASDEYLRKLARAMEIADESTSVGEMLERARQAGL